MQVDFSQAILAIDTSTTFLSLALNVGEQHYLVHEEVGNKQSDWILPKIEELLMQANIKIADLAAIVYAQGAGAFTGLRMGLSVAQGLATALNTPLVGVPCQDAVASLLPDCECVLAATDARMGEVFYAFFDTRLHQRLSDYGVAKWENIALPEHQSLDKIKGVGNAFALPSAADYFSGSSQMPTAQHYLDLAKTGRYPAVLPAQAELLYVRNKIALTLTEQMSQGK